MEMTEFNEGVILDVTPGSAALDEEFLEKLGHPVLVCHGPSEVECPLLAEGSCSLVDRAHGVIFKLDLDRPHHRAILKRYQQVFAEDVPIRAVVTQEQAARYAELLSGVQVWTHDPTVGELDGFAAEVEAADDSRTGRRLSGS
jgi:hypothetical protein